MQWQDVCNVTELQENLGIAVLVNNLPVAIFYLPSNDEQGVYAIHNYDPIHTENVLSEGVISHIKGEPVVKSPLSEQHFNLYTGTCVEDTVVTVPVYACRIYKGRVEVDTRHIALLQQLIENSSRAAA